MTRLIHLRNKEKGKLSFLRLNYYTTDIFNMNSKKGKDDNEERLI